MKSPILPPTKAVLAQKECHDYVGGRLIWEELKAAHPDIVKPLRKTEQGWEYYLVSTVDTALKAAQMAESLMHPRPAITAAQQTARAAHPAKSAR